jgi:NAD(P)-dependent dehydrogenase (short-subunit alcohol dehydrogenase family)
MPAEMRDNFFANAAAGLPVGRTGAPEEIAAAVRMLLGNGYATGALLDVDGGARI